MLWYGRSHSRPPNNNNNQYYNNKNQESQEGCDCKHRKSGLRPTPPDGWGLTVRCVAWGRRGGAGLKESRGMCGLCPNQNCLSVCASTPASRNCFNRGRNEPNFLLLVSSHHTYNASSGARDHASRLGVDGGADAGILRRHPRNLDEGGGRALRQL